MTLYRFHIIDAGRTIPDEDGVELADDELALQEGRKFAEDMLHDAAMSGDIISHRYMLSGTEFGR